MNNLTDEQLDRIAAEEVLGWTLEPDPNEWCDESGHIFYRENQWHPTRDRNQSRLVVEAAIKRVSSEKMPLDGRGLLLSAFSSLGVFEKHMQESAWTWATPRQEVEAAILAVRSIEVSNG